MATRFHSGKLFGVATLVGFDEKRCRKNLPLCGKTVTRILPKLLSSDDVAGLLAELERASPYTDDDWQTASLDFDTVNLGVNIRLDDRQFQPSHRNRVAVVLRLLPQMHSIVVSKMSRPTAEDPNDDHGLSWIDVDFDDGEVDLCYNGISYNTQWNRTFYLSRDGKLIS